MNPLFRLVLSIMACASVISALPPHEQVESVLDTPKVVSNGVSNVRNLKQNVTSDLFTESEDRTTDKSTVDKIAASLGNRFAQGKHWSRLRISSPTPEAEFNSLVLVTEKKELFGSPRFVEWVRFVRKQYPESPGEKIIEILAGKYTHSGLATLLLEALKIPGQKKMARRTYQDLLEYLVQKKSSSEVYGLLKPNGMDDKTFLKSELMLVWMDHAIQVAKRARITDPLTPIRWTNIMRDEIASLPHIEAISDDRREGEIALLIHQQSDKYGETFAPLVRPKQARNPDPL